MPGEAVKTTSNAKTPLGDVHTTSWTYTDASQRACIVMHIQLAKNGLSGRGNGGQPAPASAILDGVAAQVPQAIEGYPLLRRLPAMLESAAL